MSMVTECLTDRLGSKPIQPVSVKLKVIVMEMGTETVCVNGSFKYQGVKEFHMLARIGCL